MIQGKCQTNHFGKSYFQCNIIMDSPGLGNLVRTFNTSENYVDEGGPW